MSKKQTEPPKASAKPDDLIKPKSKSGKTKIDELSDEELGQVSGGLIRPWKE